MPQVVETTVYTYAELPTDCAREKARCWYAEEAFPDDWSTWIVDDFAQIAEALGITLSTQNEHPAIWFALESPGAHTVFEGR